VRLATEFELVSGSLGGARLSLNRMAASNINSDAAIQARFSGSARLCLQGDRKTCRGRWNVDSQKNFMKEIHLKIAFCKLTCLCSCFYFSVSSEGNLEILFEEFIVLTHKNRGVHDSLSLELV
jgi:hypothetical protein